MSSSTPSKTVTKSTASPALAAKKPAAAAAKPATGSASKPAAAAKPAAKPAAVATSTVKKTLASSSSAAGTKVASSAAPAASKKPAPPAASSSSPAAPAARPASSSAKKPEAAASTVRSRPTTASKPVAAAAPESEEKSASSRPASAAKPTASRPGTAKSAVKPETSSPKPSQPKPAAEPAPLEEKESKHAEPAGRKPASLISAGPCATHPAAAAPSADPIHVDCLIIGAGFTGISAAMNLHETYKFDDFLVLEANDRVGGRNYSFEAQVNGKPTGFYFEHGAQYIGDDQAKVQKLIDRLNQRSLIVDGYQVRKQYRQQVMLLNNMRYCYDRDACSFGIGGVPPGLSLFDLFSILLMVQEICAIEGTINVLTPWADPTKHNSQLTDFRLMDFVTMAEFLNLKPNQQLNRDWVTDITAALIQVSVQAVLSAEADEMSVLYFIWYCATDSGFLNAVNDEQHGPQQYYHSKGFNHLLEAWMAPVKEKFHFNTPVQSINTSKPGAVEVIAANGQKYIAKQVICAVTPRAACDSLTFIPALDPTRQAVLSQPAGRTIKCQIFYKSQWWNDSRALSYTGYCGAVSNMITWIMDYSPASKDPAVASQPGACCLMTFTIGRVADELYATGKVTKERLVKLITEGICELMNDTRALWTSDEYLDLVYFEWIPSALGGSKYLPGGPNTLFPPGQGFLFNPQDPDHPVAADMLNFVPVNGSLVFACSEFTQNIASNSDGWPELNADGTVKTYSDRRACVGYMDGAISAGECAARTVYQALHHTADEVKEEVKPAKSLYRVAKKARKPLSGAVADMYQAFTNGLKTKLKKLAELAHQHKSNGTAAAAAATSPVKEDPQPWTKDLLFSFLTAFLHNVQAENVKYAPSQGETSSNWFASLSSLEIVTWILQNIAIASQVCGKPWDPMAKDVDPSAYLEDLVRAGKRFTFRTITVSLKPNGQPVTQPNTDYDEGCDRLAQAVNFAISSRILEASYVQGPQNNSDAATPASAPANAAATAEPTPGPVAAPAPAEAAPAADEPAPTPAAPAADPQAEAEPAAVEPAAAEDKPAEAEEY